MSEVIHMPGVVDYPHMRRELGAGDVAVVGTALMLLVTKQFSDGTPAGECTEVRFGDIAAFINHENHEAFSDLDPVFLEDLERNYHDARFREQHGYLAGAILWLSGEHLIDTEAQEELDFTSDTLVLVAQELSYVATVDGARRKPKPAIGDAQAYRQKVDT